MFEYLKGTVVDIVVDKIIIEVNGIGYKVNSTLNSVSKIKKGKQVIIYTHLVVRDDELNLYGFASIEELSMFKLLLTVTKIGPKVASAILSTHSPSMLGAYILNKDIKLICKAPGVGKKTAERMILELKDKIDEIDIEYDYPLDGKENIAISDEAVEALLALGYNRLEAERAVQSVKGKDLSTENILKDALKYLSK